MKRRSAPGIVVHDDRHRVHAEAVCLGHQALSETVCDVIRAQQPDEDDGDLERHEPEGDRVPALQHEALELHVWALAPGKHGARVTHLRDGSFHERGEETAAVELVLYAEPVVDAKVVGPLEVDLTVEVEVAPLEGGVAWNDEEGETYPEEEGVYGEEGAVVEEDAGPADNGGDDGEAGGDGGDDELVAVAYPHNVGVCPDVEPRTEKKYHACERITREL